MRLKGDHDRLTGHGRLINPNVLQSPQGRIGGGGVCGGGDGGSGGCGIGK